MSRLIEAIIKIKKRKKKRKTIKLLIPATTNPPINIQLETGKKNLIEF